MIEGEVTVTPESYGVDPSFFRGQPANAYEAFLYGALGGGEEQLDFVFQRQPDRDVYRLTVLKETKTQRYGHTIEFTGRNFHTSKWEDLLAHTAKEAIRRLKQHIEGIEEEIERGRTS